MSMRPNRSRARFMATVAPAKVSRSAVIARASAPAASASCRTPSTRSERSTRATLPPSRARRRATVWPMPCAAPVTTATLPAKRPAKVVIAASRRGPVGLADGGDCAARRELLIVEIGRRDALLAEPGANRVHHGWRAAEIDIHLAAVQGLRLDMYRDIALARVGTGLGRHTGGEAEARDARGVLLQSVDAHEVGVVGHAVDHADRLPTGPRLGDFAEHGQERRETGAAGEEEQRAPDLPQVEAAGGAGELHRRARLC